MTDKDIYFKCISDLGIHLIAAKDIIIMKPVISKDNKPYIRIEFEDDELYITNCIYCSEVENVPVGIL